MGAEFWHLDSTYVEGRTFHRQNLGCPNKAGVCEAWGLRVQLRARVPSCCKAGWERGLASSLGKGDSTWWEMPPNRKDTQKILKKVQSSVVATVGNLGT